MEFHADIFRAVHFHKAGRPLAVVENFRVGRVVADDDLILLRELNHPLEVVLGHDDGRRIVRRVQPHQLGLPRHIFGDRVQIGQEPVGFRERHNVRDPAAEARADRIDRVAGAGDQHDIAGINECQMDVADAFLRTDQRQHFVGRVQRHVEPALVPISYRRTERQHALIRGILMVLRVFGRLRQALDDRRRCGQIRIADAEVDDIHALGNCRLFHLIDSGKEIGR